MAATGNIKADQIGIGDVLRYNRLVVPPNQREYAWEDEHVLDLFQDYATAIDSENTSSSYFLGTIVLTQGKDGQLEVSDGQQRLATSTILLAAIRDYFAVQSDDELASSIEQDFLFNFDREAREKLPKLTLNIDDRDYFKNTILSRPDVPERSQEPKKDSHRKIKTAAKIIAKKLAEVLKPYSPTHRTDLLNKWTLFIQKRAQVILLNVPDEINAYVMFETLNGRGLRTSQADLLKNYLFQKAGAAKLPEAQQKWAAMTGALESQAEEDITVTYLRHLLSTLHGPTREREVFDKVKKEISTQGRAMHFLSQLADSANDYVSLLNPSHPKWVGFGDGTRRSLQTLLAHMRVEQIRLLMFAVLKHFTPKETEKAFRMCVAWTVRLYIVGRNTGILDREYAVRALEIGTGKITTAKQLAEAMKNIVPLDEEFQIAFAEARVTNNNFARYLLRSMQTQADSLPEPELLPNDDRTVITLEHVLPENPNGNWPDIDPADAELYFRRIGNMVLLTASKNSIIGNRPFAEKRPHLAASAYSLTKGVGKKVSWGIKDIKERQKALAAIAVKTWPFEGK